VPRLGRPRALFFDWHGTLADTFEAMYRAVEEMLAELEALELAPRLRPPGAGRLPEHEVLVAHVRAQRNLPAEVKRARRISRTEIFEILFGADEEAKHRAHEAFDRRYARHAGEVRPFEPDVRGMVGRLRAAGLRTGLLTNRRRALLGTELREIDSGGWEGLFDVVVCGDDVQRRKPAPDMVALALAALDLPPGPDTWFIGDSTTDVMAAQQAGVRAIFYNGARWSPRDLVRIFPPGHSPEAIAADFAALEALALPPSR
jgi:phosphoglycolate phosphatase